MALWQLTNYAYSLTCTGYIITVNTDDPCHNYLRFSEKEPHTHTHPVVLRGLRIRDNLDYCFTVYWDIEQDEPGDTLVHTFTIEPWPDCKTRHFYFFASVNGVYSPSTSGIFTISRPHVICAPAHAWDFRCNSAYRPNLTQAIGYQGLGGFVNDSTLTFHVDYHAGWGWRVHRSVMVFDVDSIPSNALIDQIDVFMFITGIYGVSPGKIRLLEIPSISFPGDANSYSKLLFCTTILGHADESDVVFNEYLRVPLDVLKFSYGVPGSKMCIALRSNSDFTYGQCSDWNTDPCGYAIYSSTPPFPSENSPYVLISYKC